VSGGFRIRRGSVEDAPQLAALHAPAFTDAWPEAAFASLLVQPEVTVLIGAMLARAAQGFILVRNVADEAEVLTFCVAKSARRHGLGRALLAAAFDASRERGALHVFLEVGANNAAALGLYRESGFVEIGRRSAYYRHGPQAADALVMRRILNSSPAS
jgi:[ribosomal protein S18]-alanine N-acetyltransferase